MPLQALFLDEMIDNDTELIANDTELIANDTELIANDTELIQTTMIFFYLISLRRNHVPRIREYYEEVIPTYTDLQLDLQFRQHFRMSRPTVQQLCLVLGNCPQVQSEQVHRQFNFENKSL